MDRTAASSTDRSSRAGGSSRTRREFLGTVPGLALVAGTGISAQVADTGTQAQQIAPPQHVIAALWYAAHKPALLDAVLRRTLNNYCLRTDCPEPTLAVEDVFGDWDKQRLKHAIRDLAGIYTEGPPKVELFLAGDSIAAEAVNEVKAEAGNKPFPSIVYYIHGDPSSVGLLPENNATGATNLSAQATGRKLDLLWQTVPGLHHLALVGNPSSKSVQSQRRVAREWVRTHAPLMACQDIDLDHPNNVPGELQKVSPWTQAMLILSDPITSHRRGEIAKFALERRIVTMFGKPEGAHDGGMMAYAADRLALMAAAAQRIVAALTGAGPSQTPAERVQAVATQVRTLNIQDNPKLDFIINVKTARAMGFVIPPWVMAQADIVLWNEAPTWYEQAPQDPHCAEPM